jgi:hypothetical protein
MEAYATQFPAMDGGAKRMLSDPEVHRFELRWDLAAGAAG